MQQQYNPPPAYEIVHRPASASPQPRWDGLNAAAYANNANATANSGGDSTAAAAAAHQAVMAAAAQEGKVPMTAPVAVSMPLGSPPTKQSHKIEQMPGGAPPAGSFKGASAIKADEVGTFNGGSYRVSHRDANSLLTVQLAMGAKLKVKSGKSHVQ